MSTAAIKLRDAICQRLVGLSGYKTLTKVYVPQLQPDQLPAISCHIVQSTSQADGDGNAGALEFVTSVVIAISITRGFEDPIFLDGRVDSDLYNIADSLFTDPSFVKFGDTDSDGDGDDDDDPLFESVEQITSRRLFPQTGETYFAEARLEITFKVREGYEPVIPDDYLGMDITARPLGKDEYTPAITLKIDQTQD